MLVQQKKITVEEFLRMDFPDDDAYYELINGEIVKKSAPNPRHQYVSIQLSRSLLQHVSSKKLGEVFTAPIDVFLSDVTKVQPDIIFVSTPNSHIIDYDNGIIGTPDLTVEIISPSSVTRDRLDKMAAYEAASVKEYWIIDPNNRTFEIYKLDGTELKIHDFKAEEGSVESKLLTGFVCDLGGLFPGK